MQFIAICKNRRCVSMPAARKFFLLMRLAGVILLATALQVSARGLSQKVTLSYRNVPVQRVFREIIRQTGFSIIYDESEFRKLDKVSVDVKDAPVEDVLNICFRNIPYRFQVINNTIVVSQSSFAAYVSRNAIDNPAPPMDISGKITDDQGKPLAGATVKLKGTNITTVTDEEGHFTLKVPEKGGVLVCSYVGFENQEKIVNHAGNYSLSLKLADSKAEESVVIGYGSQRKASLTAAVSSIKSDEIASIPTSNLSNVLAGRLSGTFVQSGTGTPGISSAIRVRAQSSWNGSDPIFVIDGIVRDKTSFDALDPNEVDEITILKDASSAAIYGSRSSNGVILVTSKTGKSGKAIIQYTSVFSVEKTGRVPGYMDMGKALDVSEAVNGGISPEEKAWVLKNNPGGMNYYHAAYQDPNNQKHSLSASGGNENVTYYIGGSFFNEKGFLPNVWYKKYNLRGNVQAKLTKDFTVGLNLNNNYGTRNRFNFTYDGGSSDLNNLWGKLLYWNVFAPAYIDGKPVNPGWLGNPVEMMRNGGYWQNTNQQIDALLTAEYKIPYLPGLSFKASYSKNFDNSFIKDFAKKQLLYNFQTTGANNNIYTNTVVSTQMSGDPGTEYIGNSYVKTNSYQLNGQLNYMHSFGAHFINAMAAYEQYEYQYNAFSMYRYNFPLFPTDQFFAASANSSDWSTSGSESQDGRLSYVGRVNYEYAGKWLFSGSVRRDGSVKFAPDKRWGWFPSLAGGWVISKEGFFSKSKARDIIDMLKLRFSFGSTGNDAIGGWQWQDQYNIQGSTYYLGNPGTAAPRLAYGGIPNPGITWEKSNSFNLGLDMKLLKNFTFTTELWKRHTYDILGSRILVMPSEFGGSLPAVNYGVVDSKGLEFELGYNNTIGKDFSFAVKGNIGLATTKVIQKDVASNTQPVNNPNGKTLNYGTGLKATGIFRTQAELDALPAGYTINGVKPELGMMNFADVSGPDGKPDGKVDGYDNIILGNYFGSGSAPVSFGLNLTLSYKGFTVNTLFAGLTGYKISYNDAWGRNFGGGGKIPLYHDNAWSETNPNGTTPKLYPWGDGRATYTYTSTFNTYDGSFVRMKYLNIGYSIPGTVMRKIGLHAAQVFVSGTNLFSMSKFKLYDPEIYQFMSYPLMKTFSMGCNIQF